MTSDEILNKKMKLEYSEKYNLSSLPRDDLVKKKELKIMRTILDSHDGISHKELSNIIKIDRKNLRHYIKSLTSKGFIIRESERGKYYPTVKGHKEISLTADLLSRPFISMILDNENFPVNCPYHKENDNDNTQLEDALIRFSNKIGGYVVYMLIQAMNPANKITVHAKNILEKDIIVKSWFEDAISSIHSSLLPCFKNSIFPFLSSIDAKYIRSNSFDIDGDLKDEVKEALFTETRNYKVKLPLYTLDNTVVSELSMTFSKLFPNLNDELEKIRLKLPRLVAQEENHIRINTYRLKQQKICKHDYRPPANNKYNNHLILHCWKCHTTKRHPSIEHLD